MMKKSMVRDMTEGSPMRLILGFALPLLLGFAFQQLYSFVDTMIVGKTLGSNMLAAVGSTGSVNFLILGLCSGMCSGMSIPIAQAFGAKEETELRRFTATAIWVCAAFSVVIGLVTGTASPLIMRWMNTDASIINEATAYIRIIFYAIPVLVLYNMASCILRSLGDSKTPVIFLAIASVINIVLDLVFIRVLGMGVEGAAYATVISQLVSGIGCVVVMIRYFPILHLSEDDRKFRPQYAKHQVMIGIPMGLQFSITAIGAVLLTWAVNGISVQAVAAMTASSKLSTLFYCVFDALSTTMATFAGQNIGARKVNRVNQGLKACSVIGVIYCLVAQAAIYFFGGHMISLFLDAGTEQQVISMAYHFIRINSTFFIPLLFVNIVRLSIQGMGYTNIAMIAGVMEMIARAAVALLLIPVAGFEGACYASPAAWVLADVFLFPCYFKVIRHFRMQQAGS